MKNKDLFRDGLLDTCSKASRRTTLRLAEPISRSGDGSC
jgi:hypothetical protein